MRECAHGPYRKATHPSGWFSERDAHRSALRCPFVVCGGARVDLLEAMLEQTTDGKRKEDLQRELEVVRKEHARRVEGKRLEKK
jgi:hypothetical protein